jgi:uncharacterized membrane protein YhaH (DUF805 family)
MILDESLCIECKTIFCRNGYEIDLLRNRRKSMTFIESIKTVCYLKYFNFSERASRSEYWWFVLGTFLLLLGLSLIFYFTVISEIVAGSIYSIISLFLVIPSIAVQVRRLHDLDRSGWWLLLSLIPLIGSLILLYWYIKQGDSSANRFGQPPV